MSTTVTECEKWYSGPTSTYTFKYLYHTYILRYVTVDDAFVYVASNVQGESGGIAHRRGRSAGYLAAVGYGKNVSVRTNKVCSRIGSILIVRSLAVGRTDAWNDSHRFPFPSSASEVLYDGRTIAFCDDLAVLVISKCNMGAISVGSTQDCNSFVGECYAGRFRVHLEVRVSHRADDNDMKGGWAVLRTEHVPSARRDPELGFEAIDVDGGEEVSEWAAEVDDGVVIGGLIVGNPGVGGGIVHLDEARTLGRV